MIRTLACITAFAVALLAQLPPPRPHGPPDEDVRLPNGKSQKDAINKDDYKKNLEESRELVRLAESLRDELEKSDPNVVSMAAIKKTEEMEKLAKRIRGRLKR